MLPKSINKLVNLRKFKIWYKFYNCAYFCHHHKHDTADFTGAVAGSTVTGEVKYSMFNEGKPQELLQILNRE